jgi:Putative restriction endonuclease
MPALRFTLNSTLLLSLIIELLSDSTAAVDRGVKRELYQNRFQTQEYFWFSPNTQEFAGFKLVNRVYQPIAPNQQGWLWSEELGLYLGVLVGRLRYFTPAGELVPTPEEAAEQASQRAEQESQRAEALAERLRALGVDPDQP